MELFETIAQSINPEKLDGNVISPIFRWKKDAKKEDVKAHLDSLDAAITYFKNRDRQRKLSELTAERNSLIKFYNL